MTLIYVSLPRQYPNKHIKRVDKVSKNITVYTHPDCTYSDALKEELNELAVDFDEVNLALYPAEWEKVEELTGGERITPVMVTGETVEVGFHGVG